MGYSHPLVFLVILSAALGIALGVLLLNGPAQLRSDLRALPALGLGALFLLSAEWLPIPGKPGVFIVGTALLVVVLLQNRHIGGVAILAFGLFLTGFVVLINGYLPLRAEAASATNTSASGLRQDESDATTLGILGDVIPIGPFVLSFGDLIGTAGAFIVGRHLVRHRAPARTHRRSTAGDSKLARPTRPQNSNAPTSAEASEPLVLGDPHPVPTPVAISADEFLARYLELDDVPIDLDDSEPGRTRPGPARNPVIDLRDMPEPPSRNSGDRFIRVQSADDQES